MKIYQNNYTLLNTKNQSIQKMNDGRAWRTLISNITTQYPGELSVFQKGVYTVIPLNKIPLHTEAEDVGNKLCFFLRTVAGIMLQAFSL